MSTPDPRTPSLEELIRIAFDYYLDDVHTSFPARVVSYESKTQKVTVQPIMQRIIRHADGTEDLEDLAPITDVPVMFLRSRNFFFAFPISPGDLMTVFVTEKSIDSFLSSNGQGTGPNGTIDPNDFRKHHLSDAMAMPAGYPFSEAIKDVIGDAMVLGHDEGGLQLHIGKERLDIKLGGKATKHLVLAEDLQSWYENELKPWLRDHVHPSSGAKPSLPEPPGWDSGINSNVVAIPENK